MRLIALLLIAKCAAMSDRADMQPQVNTEDKFLVLQKFSESPQQPFLSK